MNTQTENNKANANTTTNETKYTNFFAALHDRIDIDFNNYLDIEDHTTIEDIEECLQDNNALDVEVIYYSNAIAYLQQHDPSFQESLGLATEMGYTTENLNSELLASLLSSSNLRDEFSEMRDEIQEFLEGLEEVTED